MDRRALLIGTGAAVAAGLTGSPATGAPVTAGPVTRAAPAPLVGWQRIGGFVPVGVEDVRPARLMLYPATRAIVDNNRQLRLPGRVVDDLRRHLLSVLRDPASTRPLPDAPVIADAPETRLTVRTGHRTLVRQVSALGESRSSGAYPERLYDLVDHLTAVRDRVLSRGTPYRPAAVRLVVVTETGTPTGTPTPWPAGVPVPATGGHLGYGRADLRGSSARRAAAAIPHRDTWTFTAFRLPDGRVLRAAWRYLLPHE